MAAGSSVVVGGVVPGEGYKFQVVAVAEINGSIVEGERSAVVMATTPGGRVYIQYQYEADSV